MNCPSCNDGGVAVRMGCTFTKQIGKRSRYRSYRCPTCKHFEETVEMPVILLPPTTEEVRLLQVGIAEAKATRFRFSHKKVPLAT